MTYFGICMGVNDIVEGIQIFEHRMLYPVNPNLPYNVLKDKLVNTVFMDKHFTKPLSLNSVLTKCLTYNVIPLINITCEDWYEDFTSNVYLVDIAKIAGVIRDYLKERGFSKGNAYIGLFNEPKARTNMSSNDISDYTNAVHDEVGEDFDVVYGNDEFNMLDWNYLGQNCKAKVMGVHHLSSLGFWGDPYKYFSNIEDSKTIADTYGKKLIGTECGSWFVDYCKGGHQVNLDIMKKCKKYNYLGCLIVLPHINQYSKTVWKLLGYVIYNNDFTKKVGGCDDKFNEFMDFIKLNGTVPDMEDDMKLKSVYKNGMKKEIGIKFIQMILNDDMKPVPLLKVDGWWGSKTDAIVLEFQKKYNLAQYGGAIGPNTMQFMIKKYPSIWNTFDYLYRISSL